MVLTITAFYIRIYLRNLTFQENLVFSFYWTVVKVFVREIKCPKNFTRVRKNVIYPGLLSGFCVVISDDIFLRQ